MKPSFESLESRNLMSSSIYVVGTPNLPLPPPPYLTVIGQADMNSLQELYYHQLTPSLLDVQSPGPYPHPIPLFPAPVQP